MTEDTTEKTEYNELRHRIPKFFKPVGSQIQQTVPSEPTKALQLDEEQLVRLENAFLHPFHALNNIQAQLAKMSADIDLLYKDTLTRRQHHDDPATIGLTLNYQLKYYNHTYVYCYSNTGFTLAVSNGASQVIPANYWTLVNYPRDVYFTVQGGSDTVPIICMFRSCDVPLEPGISEVSIQGTIPVSGPIAVTQSGTWTNGATSDYPAGATPLTGASGNAANTIATATLTGVAGKFTYIAGFEVTGSGATAGLPVIVTVTGTVTTTLSYIYSATVGVLLPNTPLVVEFAKPIPSSAVNISIVVSCPALGLGNTNNAVVAHGYTL